jgi:hypothetical protein
MMAGGAGGTPGAERPRDVYLRACEQIASACSASGFRYLTGKHQLSREAGAFRHLIELGSDFRNQAGSHVRLSMAHPVCCPALGAWRSRQAHPLRPNDYVGGGGIAGRWNLVEPGAVGDAIRHIQEVVLPYQGRFTDPEAVLSDILAGTVRDVGIDSQVEFALCFGGREPAERVFGRYVDAHAEMGPLIQQQVERLRRDGFPRWAWNGSVDLIARVAVGHGLRLDGVPLGGGG